MPHIPSTSSRPAASANARKSRSRVRRKIPRSIQVWAINASPRRALRPLASALALRIPARCQKPCSISIKGTSASVSATRAGSFGSLKSSVRRPAPLTPVGPPVPCQVAAHLRLCRLQEKQSRCSCRLQSSVSFQFCQSAGEPYLAAELPQASVSSRRCHQLQSGTDGLSDAGAAGSLCLGEQFAGYLHRDLARCLHNTSHNTVLNTSIEYGMAVGE